jgi:pSer/pThr/pTyr-binding forkhead associated (FHA) protein
MAIRLVVKKTGTGSETTEIEVVFDEALINIGSDPMAMIFLDDDQVSDEHAVILNDGDEILLLNQSEGTILNGEDLPEGARRTLIDGDEIQINPFLITVKMGYETNELNLNGYELAQVSTANVVKEELKPGTFADILNSLRKEEDRFYFQIESDDKTADKKTNKLFIEEKETLLGWDEKGQLAFNSEAIVKPRLLIRKDWSGITVYPHENATVWVNGEEIKIGVRLQNSDRVNFASANSLRIMANLALIFCEPASLIELNSLLPQKLHDSQIEVVEITNDANAIAQIETAGDELTTDVTAVIPKKKASYRYFGYFSLLELLIMLIGTILTGAIIYLLLELF